MSDWKCVFRRETPWTELQDIIETETRTALHVWLDTLLDTADLSDAARAQVWAFGALKIREQQRTMMEAAWTNLQRETSASDTVQ